MMDPRGEWSSSRESRLLSEMAERRTTLAERGGSSSGEAARSVADRFDDALISRTPAKVSAQDLTDLLVGGARMFAEEPDHAHQDAGSAEAALQSVVLAEGLLEGMEPVRR